MEHLFDDDSANPMISLSEARSLLLLAQGLYQPPAKPAFKTDVLGTIQALGVLQIDTINIVARAPYLSLWSRLGSYDPKWLNELLEEKKVFEFWAHAASFLPIEDYPIHRRIMLERIRLPNYEKWYQSHKIEADAVLEYVRKNGETRSKDFVRSDGKKGTWWNWKVEKDALEYWFSIGELMVSKRVNFQRVYDLRERVSPDVKESGIPDLESSIIYLVEKSVQALGVAKFSWIKDYFRLSKTMTLKALQSLSAQKRILEVQVESWGEPGWMSCAQFEQYRSGNLEIDSPNVTTLLSPFDSLVWDRTRTRELFDFDFTIECYLPVEKRKYGYFLLPILHKGSLIGRLDAKAHRADCIFEVVSVFLEKGVEINKELAKEVASMLRTCAQWHNTPQLIVRNCDNQIFKEHILEFLLIR